MVSEYKLFKRSNKYRQAKHNNNADALSRMNDKLELTRFEDVKTLLPNFAAGTVIPGEIVSNTQTQSVETIYSEESFITFPSLSIQELRNVQKNDPVIGQFVEIWKTKLKPSTAEERKFSRPLVSLLRQWDRIQVENGLFYRVVNDPIHHDLIYIMI